MTPRYDAGREWLTEAEIKNLIAEEMKPFHQQNLTKFDSIFTMLNSMNIALSGINASVKTAAWIIGTILCIIGILVAAYHH